MRDLTLKVDIGQHLRRRAKFIVFSQPIDLVEHNPRTDRLDGQSMHPAWLSRLNRAPQGLPLDG